MLQYFFLLDRSMCTTFKCSLRNDSFFTTLFSRAQCTYQQKQSKFSIKKLHLLEKRVLRVCIELGPGSFVASSIYLLWLFMSSFCLTLAQQTNFEERKLVVDCAQCRSIKICPHINYNLFNYQNFKLMVSREVLQKSST